MPHIPAVSTETHAVSLRVAQPDELNPDLAAACGKLMPYMYPGDKGEPVSLDRLNDVGRYPSTLIIATLGEVAFTGGTEPQHNERTDVPPRTVTFPGDTATYKRLSQHYPVVGQAIVHRIGGFRDGREWLEDLVVHPEARGGSPSIGATLYDMAYSLSRERGSRALFYVSAPRRVASHHLYTRSGAVILAGDESSPTNLFAHNHYSQ